MFVQFLYPLLSLVPVSILLAAVRVWRWFEDAKGLRSPVKDKLLRPPGESARRKIDELDDKIMDTLICFLGFPAILLVCYLSSNGTAPRPIPNFWTIIMVMLAGGFVLLRERLISLVQQRDHWRLSFSSERLVGEELNKLMCEGCQVFHDFPLAEKNNLNHIVVAPSGVYAIATCARRKGAASASQKAHEVIYDGEHIQFPDGRDTEALKNVSEQAEQLGKFLSEKLQVPIKPKALLTLPGWYVIPKAQGEVLVLNPKMVDLTILKDVDRWIVRRSNQANLPAARSKMPRRGDFNRKHPLLAHVCASELPSEINLSDHLGTRLALLKT